MPVINAAHVQTPVTANSTSGGLVTVASNANFIAGATVTMKVGSTQTEYIVVDKVGTTQLRLRSLQSGNRFTYGYSNLAAFTLAGAATITQSAQPVHVQGLGRGLPAPTKDGQVLTSDSTQPGGVKWV